MKKILLTSFLSILSLVGFSQTGIKGGLNLATIGGDASGVDSKADFHIGLFFLTKKSETFGIQPEIIYSRQGAQASGNSSVKINYDYLNVPVMFNYYPEEKFFIQGGPQLGILLSGKIKEGDNSLDVKDQLNTVDLSLGLGIGYDTESVILGLRYNIGLTSTASDSNGNFPNRVLQISIGFRLNN
jgi:hypothetical protein